MSKRLALIIGNSLYRDQKLTRLKAPDADVGELTDVLLDPELGGFDDVKLLVNSASHIVRREIFNFFAKKTREDMLLFYFSGHGVLDDQGKLFLALKDTDTEALRGTAIPASYITNEMDSSRSKRQVVILDCCHSGAFARGSKGSPGVSVGTASTFEGSGYGRVVLTASDATQFAWEGDRIIGESVNSLFTHYLVKGIKTGEADTNHDGKITVDELYDYTYARILNETSKQTPGKWSFKEQGELIISRSSDVETPSPHPQEIPVIRREVEQELRQLYNRGLSAYWLEEWDFVLEYFEAIQELSPGYMDVEEKLEEAKEQKKKEDIYKQAVLYLEEGNLESAISSLETLLDLTSGYKDASELLLQIRSDKEVEDLSGQAKQLFESGMFEAVVKIIEKIRDNNPNYDDAEKLLERSNQELRERKRIEKLEYLYSQSLLDMNAGNFETAKNHILQIQEIEKGYKDADKLLAKVNDLIKENLDKYETELEFTNEQIGIEPEVDIHRIGEVKPSPEQKPTRVEKEKKGIDEQESPKTKAITNIPKWIWGIGVVALIIGVILGGTQLVGGWRATEAPETSSGFMETKTNDNNIGDKSQPTTVTGETILGRVLARGKLKCGVHGNNLGFGYLNNEGEYTGFDVDLCRAVAAAVLGDPTSVEFIPLTTQDRGPALQSFSIDLLSRNVIWTLSKDYLEGNFTVFMFYDSQTFMTRKDSGIQGPEDFAGATVCVVYGTTTEANLKQYFSDNGWEYEPVIFEDNNDVVNAYESGRCDLITMGSRSLLASVRSGLVNPGDHIIFNLMIADYAITPVVPLGDDTWLEIVRIVMNSLINAEDLGITKDNVGEMANNSDTRVRTLLGTGNDWGYGQYGLDPDALARAIAAVGNYGELYDYYFGEDGLAYFLERGPNANTKDGGLISAPPIQ